MSWRSVNQLQLCHGPNGHNTVVIVVRPGTYKQHIFSCLCPGWCSLAWWFEAISLSSHHFHRSWRRYSCDRTPLLSYVLSSTCSPVPYLKTEVLVSTLSPVSQNDQFYRMITLWLSNLIILWWSDSSIIKLERLGPSCQVISDLSSLCEVKFSFSWRFLVPEDKRT